jgi:hypothetical protein
MTFAVLFIAGYFADHNDAGIRWPLAENDLRRVPVQVAAAAFGRGGTKQGQFMFGRNPICRRRFLASRHLD